ncbi:uncharacterized protein LOC129618452 [Condylostylus longicornis]|uniref:uncharacterized protein LOC129618452 n=1 Tax=Condylostylus longicornis TaxID=2530218 RepID=UPI00244E359F|nr:uncharacterized protein LOC129618452 [Condylostylus longicornis]
MLFIHKLSIYFIINSLFLIGFIQAYEQYIGNARHDDYPNKCYHQDTGKAMEFGEVWRPTNRKYHCEKLTCRDDYVIMINSCPRYQVTENCKVISNDYTQPYPKCCPSLACRDRNGNLSVRPTHTEYEDINNILV